MYHLKGDENLWILCQLGLFETVLIKDPYNFYDVYLDDYWWVSGFRASGYYRYKPAMLVKELK